MRPVPILSEPDWEGLAPEQMLPVQWAPPPADGDPTRRLKWAMLREVLSVLSTWQFPVVGVRASMLLNLMAWVEDADGGRARRAGCPYSFTLGEVVESLWPWVEPEAVAEALRARYRARMREAGRRG